MKVKFLGTAAAEGIPAIFCNCSACKQARQSGGKNVRTRSQILVNDDLIIDFPPDTYMHVLREGFDMSAVKNVLITHAHPDHCYPLEFVLHGSPFAHELTERTLGIYGNKTVINLIEDLTRTELSEPIKQSLGFHTVKPYESFTVGDYEVTALPAVHTVGEDCLLYLISKDNKTYFQFNDSGILKDEVYDFLKDRGTKIDLVSFDCTFNFKRVGANRHMGIFENADERERMAARGLLSPNAKFVITHFSHNVVEPHETLCEKAAELNFIVAYDGFEVEI